MTGSRLGKRALVLAGLLVATAIGCRNYMPHRFGVWIASGDTYPTHPAPPGKEYYENWDPWALELEVLPVNDVNPVRTQHVLVATVKDKHGKGLPNRRVEWIISEGSVGDIVAVDESGIRASRGYKVDNHFAVSHTNNGKHVLDMGNDDPSDDVQLMEGQTWCVITSPVEGTSYVTVYAPGIYDWAKHKVFVTKHWMDVHWEFPADATNPIGTNHTFTTRLTRASDGTPLENYQVTYKLLDGPAGGFDGGRTIAATTTNAEGVASVTLNQAQPIEGTNTVEIDIVRPADIQCCKPAQQIATGTVRKTWIGPKIGITKDCAAEKMVNEEFTYDIVVTNPATVPATNVTVTDNIPDGIRYVSSNPAASAAGNALTFSLGSLDGGASRSIQVTVAGTREGTFDNTANVTADFGLQASDGCQTRIVAPALALEKTCPQQVMLCEEFTHTVIVRNNGSGPASNVRVVDNLPDGVTTTDGRTTVEFDAGTLAPGQAKEGKFAAKATRTGTFTNRATATADGGLTASAECTTRIVQPVLAVTKTGPEKRYIGRPADYQITVTNTGDAPATNTLLVDQLPGGMTFVSASDGGAQSGGTVTWSLGTLEPGASRTVTISLKAMSAGDVKNVVRATATCTEATAEVGTAVEGVPAILLEVVDLADPIEVGGTETYVITVTNQGSADDRDIVITCELAPQQSFVDAQGPTTGTASGQTVTFAPLPSLAPKQKVEYRVQVKGTDVGDVRFKTTLTSRETEVPVQETESTHIY